MEYLSLLCIQSHSFLNGAVLHLNGVYAVPLTSQYLLEKVHVALLCHRLLCLQRTYRTVVHTNIKILDFLTYNLFRIKYLRQPSINFDFCNLSSSGDIVYKDRWWHWHKLRYTDSDYPFGISGDVVYKERWWHWHKLRFTDSDYPFGICGDVVYKESCWHWHKLRYTDSDYPFGISGDVVYKERWWPWHKPWFTDSDLQTFLTDLSYDYMSILHVKVAKYKMPWNWKISEI